jgi:excisionase family DNA binding protein
MRIGSSQGKLAQKEGKGTMLRANRVRHLKSLPQAAEELGVSVRTLRSWIYQRKISYLKIGRCVRISDETIQQIINRGSIPALESE